VLEASLIHHYIVVDRIQNDIISLEDYESPILNEEVVDVLTRYYIRNERAQELESYTNDDARLSLLTDIKSISNLHEKAAVGLILMNALALNLTDLDVQEGDKIPINNVMELLFSIITHLRDIYPGVDPENDSIHYVYYGFTLLETYDEDYNSALRFARWLENEMMKAGLASEPPHRDNHDLIMNICGSNVDLLDIDNDYEGTMDAVNYALDRCGYKVEYFDPSDHPRYVKFSMV
jgi:hypothetical protein